MKKKTYVLTLSRVFLSDHPRAGEPTNFKEKLASGEKIHTIRAGEYWKNAVEEVNADIAALSVREWIGRPYASGQVEIARFERLGWQSFEMRKDPFTTIQPYIAGFAISPDTLCDVAENDGLGYFDFLAWFKYPRPFAGGIIHFTDFRY